MANLGVLRGSVEVVDDIRHAVPQDAGRQRCPKRRTPSPDFRKKVSHTPTKKSATPQQP